MKNYYGNIEFVYGEKTIILTEKNPTIILTEEEYETIPEHKQYLIDNMFVIVEFMEEEVKKETKSRK